MTTWLILTEQKGDKQKMFKEIFMLVVSVVLVTGESTNMPDACSAPPSFPNAENILAYPTVVYYCRAGYSQTDGDRTMQCMNQNGRIKWIGEKIKCERNTAIAANVVVGVVVPVSLVLVVLTSTLTALCFRKCSPTSNRSENINPNDRVVTSSVPLSRAQTSSERPHSYVDMTRIGAPFVVGADTAGYESLQFPNDTQHQYDQIRPHRPQRQI